LGGVRDYHAGANQGEANGEFNYGIRPLAGHSVTKNQSGALEYLELASAKHRVEADVDWGLVLSHDLGPNRVTMKSAESYKKAADIGHRVSQFQGRCKIN
jgi:TPR repeat protein